MKEISRDFKQLRKLFRSLIYFSIIAAVAVCSRPAMDGVAAERKPVPAPAPNGSKAAAPESAAAAAPLPEIPLADIATRATEVASLLNSLETSLAPGAAIENIAKSLPDHSQQLDDQIKSTKIALEAEPALETLQALQQQWLRFQLDTTSWLNTLTQEATKLQDGLNKLADLQQLWSTTRGSARAAKAPDPIADQIDATLKTIAAAQTKLQNERAAVLGLQSRVAADVTKCGAMVTQIGLYQQKAVAGIFVPDAPPLSRVDLWSDAVGALPDHIQNVRRQRWADLAKYATQPREGMAVHAALFLALSLVFYATRTKVRRWKKSGAPVSAVLSVFERPFSAAMAIALLFATSPFFQIPNAVRQSLIVIGLVPMLRLAQPALSRAVMPALYIVGVLFAVETLRQAYGGIQVIGQALLVGESAAAIVAVIFLRRRYSLMLGGDGAKSSAVLLLNAARFLIIIGLMISVVAGSAGYLRLARLLTPGILVGFVLALAAYAYLRVVGGVVALAFTVWPLRLLNMVEHHRAHLERRTYRVLIWMAVLGWSARYLAYLGLLDTAWSRIQSVLGTQLERGTISISVGGVLEFFLTVWFAYLLSRFIRFALQEDFYPRIDLAPGMSYAVSSLLNYIILALGFVAGLGVLGVDFSKVSILAGAFGVGIGFGLQSIVNNFVSGLILLFERPIHVGDIVEVGELQGTVRRIGIRASVVHTLAGADIVVPNSQLVTEKVTNWTLSDRLRRVDLPVGVNYDADPKRVIALLEQVARAHADVLTDPAPRALFIGYGDSSINFELRVWPKQFNQWAQVRSDMAVAVFDAVKAAAGMSFPFPQREVRLLHDSTAKELNPAVDLLTPVKKTAFRDNPV